MVKPQTVIGWRTRTRIGELPRSTENFGSPASSSPNGVWPGNGCAFRVGAATDGSGDGSRQSGNGAAGDPTTTIPRSTSFPRHLTPDALSDNEVMLPLK
jgi:hypothetical protein